jgi:hypothetical protein
LLPKSGVTLLFHSRSFLPPLFSIKKLAGSSRTFLAEEHGLQWAAELKALLLDMKAPADQAREQGRAF